MEKERKIFAAFLRSHARKAGRTDFRCANVQFHSPSLGRDDPLLRMSTEDVLSEMDKEGETVKWLLHQLATYDPSCQKVVALVFSKRVVVSDVLWDREGIADEE